MVKPDADRLNTVLADKLPEAVSFLAEMISHESVHGREGPVQKCIAERFASLGCEVERKEIPESLTEDPEYSRPTEPVAFAGRPNVIARKRGTGGGRSLILNAHSDVVPASEWPEGFEPKVTDETVTGRGAADDKGHVAVIYLALAAMGELGLKLRGDLSAQIVIDEEVGGNGSLALIRQGERADGVCVLEATDLKLYSANRGALWFQLAVEGRSTHMGRKWEGVSAVDLSMEAIRILYKYEKHLIRTSRRVPLFTSYSPPPTQVNIGMIRAGDWPSTVAARAHIEGGIGFLPNRSLDTVKKEVAEIFEAEASDWLKEHMTIEYDKLHNDAYVTDPRHPFVRAASRASRLCGLDGKPRGWVVSCDARLFACVAGMPTVCFGAGDINQAHSNLETIRIADMKKAAETLVYLAADWCNKRKAK